MEIRAVASERIVIIGAGVGGLVAALLLAARGCAVTLVERAAGPGGKMRSIAIDGRPIDAGPTVFTMRWVFEEILAATGRDLASELPMRRAEVLARHSWAGRGTLDLFADIDRSADAIGSLAGAAEARAYRDFCARAGAIYRTLERPFIRAAAPSLADLMRGARLKDLMGISPFATLWSELGRHFRDPRLRQLFGRYATYCGSSPFRAAATLMLVAHVEQEGVWLVDGGMHELAKLLARLCVAHGAALRYRAEVSEVTMRDGGVTGVRLAGGEHLPANAVIANADIAAIAAGRFGAAIAGVAPAIDPSARSLSAATFMMVARTAGFPLERHTVFFSDAYEAEFEDIFRRHRTPERPTVYVCAQDRGDVVDTATSGPERLFCLVNAPAMGDVAPDGEKEILQCEERMFHQLERHGLTIARDASHMVRTGPREFETMFPATGGALYGMASHGWMASFKRPGVRTRIRGLYLAGGSAHPGPGVPMAALSGRAAASALLEDWASNGRFHPVAMPGGMSTG